MKHIKILFLLLPAVLLAPMISANQLILGTRIWDFHAHRPAYDSGYQSGRR
jgi:hypothetical protein